VIKSRSNPKDTLLKKIKKLPVSLLWYDQRYNAIFEKLLEEFHEIIDLTVSYIERYDDFKKKRSEIKILFKIAKKIFSNGTFTYVLHRSGALECIHLSVFILTPSSVFRPSGD